MAAKSSNWLRPGNRSVFDFVSVFSVSEESSCTSTTNHSALDCRRILGQEVWPGVLGEEGCTAIQWASKINIVFLLMAVHHTSKHSAGSQS